MCESSGHGTVIALCGKGGVGKTTISAMIARLLAVGDRKVLAIDADPSSGLATALGFQVRKTVDDIRNSLISGVKGGKGMDRKGTASLLDYEVFEAIEERGNIAFLAIGRPEKEGCYCQVNSILKDVISAVSRSFDFVVIDGEAGIEQVNRRVLERVTHLILVTDTSAKGLNVARAIHKVSGSAISYDEAALIVNRVRDEGELPRMRLPDDIPLIGWIPEDGSVRQNDLEGRSVMELPETGAVQAVKKALERLNFAGHGESQCRCHDTELS